MSCKEPCLPTTVIEPAATMSSSWIWIQRMVVRQVGQVENQTRHDLPLHHVIVLLYIDLPWALIN